MDHDASYDAKQNIGVASNVATEGQNESDTGARITVYRQEMEAPRFDGGTAKTIKLNRRIFIGSSREGLGRAEEIKTLITRTFKDTVECVLWPEIFEPGSLTFEALEEMLMECSAAVFVVTPDDKGEIRGKEVRLPRANIMLEFGLVAGRLGRHNIALCSYGLAELPSDLAGLTIIRMDQPEAQQDSLSPQPAIIHSGENLLKRWCSRVLPTTERIPRTEIMHGYTGVWRFEVSLNKWRGLALSYPSYSHVNGRLSLLIAADGDGGYGMASGRISFRIPSGAGSGEPSMSQAVHSHSQTQHYGEFQFAHELYSVECRDDGSLRLSSRIVCVQKVHVSGHTVPELEGLFGPPEPWIFDWVLGATGSPRTLAGTFKTVCGGGTLGDLRAVKEH